MEEQNDLFYITLDVTLFLLGMAMVITMLFHLNKIDTHVQQTGIQNTTISQSKTTISYPSCTDSGIKIYDGIFAGSEVMSSLMNITKQAGDCAYEKHYPYKVAINGFDLTEHMVKGECMLDYVKEEGTSYLVTQGILNMNARYKKQYLQNANGKIIKINYQLCR